MSKYSDISQQFWYANSQFADASKALINAAGTREVARTEMTEWAHAQAVTNYNVALGKVRTALEDYKAAFQALSEYFARGEGSGPII